MGYCSAFVELHIWGFTVSSKFLHEFLRREMTIQPSTKRLLWKAWSTNLAVFLTHVGRADDAFHTTSALWKLVPYYQAFRRIDSMERKLKNHNMRLHFNRNFRRGLLIEKYPFSFVSHMQYSHPIILNWRGYFCHLGHLH